MTSARGRRTRIRLAGLLAAAALVASSHGATAGQWWLIPRRTIPLPVVIWHVEGPGWGEAAADGERAYFLGRHQLIALDKATGAERWRARLGEGDLPWGTRIVVDGTVVAAGDYDVFAFDGATGVPRWVFAPEAGHAPGAFIGAAMDGVLFTGSGGGRLHAIDVQSGRVRWSTTIEGVEPTTVHAPVVSGGLVVAAFTRFVSPREGGIVAVDRHSGAVRWRSPLAVTDDPRLDRNAAGGPAIAGARAIVASGDGFLHVFDLETGSPRGVLPRAAIERRPTAIASPDRDIRPLAGWDGAVIAASLTGVVSALDVDSGGVRWHYADPLHGSVLEHLVTGGDVVYVPFVEGELVALDLRTGRERWATAAGKGFHWAPARDGGRLFAAAKSGFYALEAPPGDRVR